MNRRNLFYIWVVVCALFTPIIIFGLKDMANIIIGNTYTKKMLVKKEIFEIGRTKTRHATLCGEIEKKDYYCDLTDDNILAWTEYLPIIPEDSISTPLDYDNLTYLKLSVPVVQFGNSRSVLFIKKDQTPQEAINAWFYPKLAIWLFLYIPLIILFILKKRHHEKES